MGTKAKTKSALDVVIAGVNKDLSNPSLKRCSDNSLLTIPYWISTGAPDLDWCLGGGLAGGRICELYSRKESEGKTTLAMNLARECQKAGGLVIFFDFEHTALPEHFRKHGVDTEGEQFLLINEKDEEEALTLEYMFEIIESTCKRYRTVEPDTPLFFIMDSLAAAQTTDEEAADYDEKKYAPAARVMSTSLKKIVAVISHAKATFLIINQGRTKIGATYGDDMTTPGGKSPKFYASQRVELRYIGAIKGKSTGDRIGIKTKAKIVKNKVGPPFRESVIRLFFGTGISYARSSIDLMLRHNMLKEEGKKGHYTHEASGTTGITKKKFKDFLDSHPEVNEEISNLISTDVNVIAGEEDSDD